MEHTKPLNVQHNRYTRRLPKNKPYWYCHPLQYMACEIIICCSQLLLQNWRHCNTLLLVLIAMTKIRDVQHEKFREVD